jgi:hypothetical protein
MLAIDDLLSMWKEPVEGRNDGGDEPTWSDFGKSTLILRVERIEKVDLAEVVGEDVLGDEGRELIDLHPQEQVGVLHKELASFLEVFAVVPETKRFGFAEQGLVGVEFQAAKLVLFYFFA